MDEDQAPGEPALAERISALSGTEARRVLYRMASVPSGEVRAGLARALDVAEQRAAYLAALAQRLLPSSATTPRQTAADDQVRARREELADELRERMRAAAEDLAWMLGQAVTRDHPAFRQAAIALGEARWLHQLVEEVVASLALRARAQGTSWGQVGLQLGMGIDEEPLKVHIDVAAFERVAAGLRCPGAASVEWACASCGQRVTDYGPITPDPAQRERGHADDCARLAAEIADWMKGKP
jgi:hypothetical protein